MAKDNKKAKISEVMRDAEKVERPGSAQPESAATTQIINKLQADLKRAEDELLLKNRTFDGSQAASSVADADGIINDANPAFLRIWGYADKSSVVGKPIQHFFNDQNEASAIITSLNSTGHWEGDFTAKKFDGSTFIAHGMATIIRDGGKAAGYCSSVVDITERRRVEKELDLSEKALKRQNDLLSALMKNIPVGVFMVEAPSGKPLLANEAACTLLGRGILPDASRQNLSEVYKARRAGSCDPYPPDQMPILLGMNGTASHIDDMVVERPDGTERFLEIFGTPVTDASGRIWASLVSFFDITERRKAEAAHERLAQDLRQAQKLEAVGQLAGGMAHDFNNMLMSIMCYAELGREELPVGHPVREWLDEIINDAKRSAAVIRQLLAFARRQPVAPKVLNLNVTVAGTLKLLRRLIGERIKLNVIPGENLWAINFDPSQIDQILMNLCVNARDAISGTGELVVETSNVIVDEVYCASHVEAVPGEYVLLTVSDDGCGMGDDVLAHIFDPFFTTKGVGVGTGLGLSTVYGIVKQNDGFITVHSEPGKGSSFKVYLPRFTGLADEAAIVHTKEVPPSRGETILLVEDDASVRLACALMLKALGYNVLSAESPTTALDVAAGHSEAIHLLLSDMVMPRMDGRQLAKQVQDLRPDIKVLFISGYTPDRADRHGTPDNDELIVTKPFSRDEIARAVRTVLEK